MTDAPRPGIWADEPRLRRFLAAVPTRPLRRVAWDRVKHWRRTGVVGTAFGARMHCDTRDFIQRFVYFFGVWEPNLTAWLPRRLAAGDVFVDVGANVGYYSLLAARVVGTAGRVVAIEAAPEIHAALERNLALNASANVRTVCAAASDAVGELALLPGGEHNVGGTSTVAVAAAGAGATRIPARPLRELLAPDELLGRMRSLGFRTYLIDDDYRSRTYLHPQPVARPARFDGPLAAQGDVVFSRVDADAL